MINSLLRTILAGIVALTISPAFAQVYRVQPRPVQQGNALDSNPRVGSGGSNAGTRMDAGAYNIESQLYVTGQVSGLGNFRGPVPYAGANQFRIDVPSAGMSGFIGRSVGLQEVQRGQVLAPTPYYAPSRTIVGPRAISAGLNQPGSSIPRSDAIHAGISSRLFVEATAQYRPIVPRADGRLLSTPIERAPIDVTPRMARDARTAPQLLPGLVSDEPLPITRLGQRLDSTSTGVMLDIVTPEDRVALAEDLWSLEMAKRIDPSVDVSALVDASITERETQTGQLPFDAPPEPAPRIVPGDGQNVYLDLLREFSDQNRQEETPEDILLAEEQALRAENPAFEEREGTIILRRFTGGAKDEFNVTIAEADRRLKVGDYYHAVYQYRLAHVYDRSNPLPHVGMGLAYFAAGEPMSSALKMREAMAAFPPIMETRLDIPSMVDVKVIDSQLARLERIINGYQFEDPDPLLPFIAAYIHNSLGNTDEARRHAKSLRELAGDDEIYRAYSNHLLGDKENTN